VLSFQPMTTPVTTITPKVNGPLRVEGPVRILTPDGAEIPVPPRKDGTPAQVVVLCRCGASATKPFCDGSHKRIGFDSSGPGPGAPGIPGPEHGVP
jgi:CDGSH-type Zn-finger protein